MGARKVFLHPRAGSLACLPLSLMWTPTGSDMLLVTLVGLFLAMVELVKLFALFIVALIDVVMFVVVKEVSCGKCFVVVVVLVSVVREGMVGTTTRPVVVTGFVVVGVEFVVELAALAFVVLVLFVVEKEVSCSGTPLVVVVYVSMVREGMDGTTTRFVVVTGFVVVVVVDVVGLTIFFLSLSLASFLVMISRTTFASVPSSSVLQRWFQLLFLCHPLQESVTEGVLFHQFHFPWSVLLPKQLLRQRHNLKFEEGLLRPKESVVRGFLF